MPMSKGQNPRVTAEADIQGPVLSYLYAGGTRGSRLRPMSKGAYVEPGGHWHRQRLRALKFPCQERHEA